MDFPCVLLLVSLIVIKAFFLFWSISGKKQDKFYVKFEKDCKSDLWADRRSVQTGGRDVHSRLCPLLPFLQTLKAEVQLPSARPTPSPDARKPNVSCPACPPGRSEALVHGIEVLGRNALS